MSLVSIVTPVYNSEKTILETLQSVQTQSHTDWEMHLVCDEGTKDRTEDVIRAQKDPRIHFHKISGRGVARARNFGMQQAKGHWLAFLDADDLWLPEKLSTQISWMEANHCAFSCHGYRRIRDGQTGREILPPREQSYNQVLLNNRIGFFTALLDRTRVQLPQFQEHPQEDWIFWLDLLKTRVSCRGLQQDLGRYRIVATSRSQRDPRLRSRWRILREREQLNLLQASWAYGHYVTSALAKRVVF